MALVTCPDCGKQISDAAPACIHCGRPKAIGGEKPKDKPIVIMGTGIPAVCAIINKLVDIAYNAPDKGPVVYVFVLDTRDRPKPDESMLYPLNGISIDAMHPFKAAKPAPHFPPFGEYAREIAADDPEWESALRAPTHRHVNEYLEYMLELSLTAVGGKAYVDAGHNPVKNIEETVANGAATIHFQDGTILHAKQILRAGEPPHMSGRDSTAGEPSRSLATEVRGVFIDNKFSYEETEDESRFVLKPFGGSPLVVMPHEEGEASLSGSVRFRLAELKSINGSELWVVTRETVSDLVASTFKGQSIRFLTLAQFSGMIELMKRTGADS